MPWPAPFENAAKGLPAGPSLWLVAKGRNDIPSSMLVGKLRALEGQLRDRRGLWRVAEENHNSRLWDTKQCRSKYEARLRVALFHANQTLIVYFYFCSTC